MTCQWHHAKTWPAWATPRSFPIPQWFPFRSMRSWVLYTRCHPTVATVSVSVAEWFFAAYKASALLCAPSPSSYFCFDSSDLENPRLLRRSFPRIISVAFYTLSFSYRQRMGHYCFENSTTSLSGDWPDMVCNLIHDPSSATIFLSCLILPLSKHNLTSSLH
jgi:hypothetical protein